MRTDLDRDRIILHAATAPDPLDRRLLDVVRVSGLWGDAHKAAVADEIEKGSRRYAMLHPRTGAVKPVIVVRRRDGSRFLRTSEDLARTDDLARLTPV